MASQRMGSRELGLVLTQQLGLVDDLHYGLWTDGLEPCVADLSTALQRYNELLIGMLPKPDKGCRVLDVGCGTGKLLGQLLDRGYLAEGVSPSAALSQLVLKRLRERGDERGRLHRCSFEDFPAEHHRDAYDAVLFAESFTYIPLERCIAQLTSILRSGGIAVICDFFRSDADGDGGPGDGLFGGGHRLATFSQPWRARVSCWYTTRTSRTW